MTLRLKGGLNFDGRGQRALFVSKSAGDGHAEHHHQSAFFSWLKWNEREHPVLARFFAVPNGGFRHKATAGKLRAEGVKPGVLDTCLPVARGGFTGLWIEFKAGKNTLTEGQEEWKAFLESEGHRVEVCYSWQEAARATVEYLGLQSHTPISAHGERGKKTPAAKREPAARICPDCGESVPDLEFHRFNSCNPQF